MAVRNGGVPSPHAQSPREARASVQRVRCQVEVQELRGRRMRLRVVRAMARA